MKVGKLSYVFIVLILAATAIVGLATCPGCTRAEAVDSQGLTVFEQEDPAIAAAVASFKRGRQIFRFDTFGDQDFWGGQLQLHLAIKGAALGGVGPGLSPNQALALGLKIDLAALDPATRDNLSQGKLNLNDPAVTVALLRANAVIGLTGFFTGADLTSIGTQCALCHSVVDNAFAANIGNRLDGWANRDLNVGAIIAFAPDLQPFVNLLNVVIPGITADQVRAVLLGWGPGKFDAELLLDGKVVNPFTGGASATLLPPAFGLAGVNLHTWTGWGSVPHWNAFVANLEMGGKGTFFDPRLNDPLKFPIAAAFNLGNVRVTPDLITPKLADLQFYQLGLPAPKPPVGSFDPALAAEGSVLFNGKAQCATCHVPTIFTEPGWNMHLPAEIGIDPFQANRAPDGRYRTPPLKGLFSHQKGGFFHDGRFLTLLDVVNHYDAFFNLNLTDAEKGQLVQFLLSL